MKKTLIVVILTLMSSFAFAGIEDRIIGTWIDIASTPENILTFVFSSEENGGIHKSGFYITSKSIGDDQFEPINKIEFDYYIYRGVLILQLKDKYVYKNGTFSYTGTSGEVLNDNVSIGVKDEVFYLIMGEDVYQKLN
jgi:hypothetical protein